MRVFGASLTAMIFGANMAHGEVAATPPPPNKKVLSVIDEDPISSTRASGMGGAIGTVADDLDAAFHNPAGIGGLNQKSDPNAPLVRKLYFPTTTVEANDHAAKLADDLKKSGASDHSTVGDSVIDSHPDQREYARAHIASGIVLGRAMIVPFSDSQIATTPRGEGSGLLDTHYRSMSGIGYGLSVQSPDGAVSLGYFGYTANRKETEGALLYDDIIDSSKRNAAINADTHTYNGSGNNFGGIWRLNAPASPTFGLNLKNAGDTTFKGSGGDDPLIVKQDAEASFSLTPHLGKVGVLNFVMQADELTDSNVSWRKKYHLGTELLLGKRQGSYAFFGLRAGYNDAGPSGGVSLHLGLIGFDASFYYVDISADNSRVVERRGSVTAFVNVAEF